MPRIFSRQYFNFAYDTFIVGAISVVAYAVGTWARHLRRSEIIKINITVADKQLFFSERSEKFP